MKSSSKIFLLILLVSAIFLLIIRSRQASAPTLTPNVELAPQDTEISSQNQATLPSQNSQITNIFQPPLDRARERVNKKPFGIYIAPATSPVQPERFSGYHTGTDFEIFPEELNADIEVKAICSGKLILKKYASGYGGVAVESCNLDNKPITVIYGHLKLASIIARINDTVIAGEALGILGADKSVETNRERKHLHLAIHQGSAINILGYVNSKNQLSDWIDGCQYACTDLNSN